MEIEHNNHDKTLWEVLCGCGSCFHTIKKYGLFSTNCGLFLSFFSGRYTKKGSCFLTTTTTIFPNSDIGNNTISGQRTAMDQEYKSNPPNFLNSMPQVSPAMLNYGVETTSNMLRQQRDLYMPGMASFWHSLKVYFMVS